MNIVVIENGLVLILLEVENTDSLLLGIPLSFINRITAFRAVNYFVDITTTA